MAAPSHVDRPGPALPDFHWSAIADLIRLRNQTGTLLLLWPSLWSLWLAGHGTPPLSLLAIFTTGAFLMRSAGVILNDLADRRFDSQVARTRIRPLVSGSLTPFHALVALACLLGASALLLAFLPPLTWPLGLVAVVLAALYPLAKRVVAIPQAFLGVAFGWGTIVAWAAVHERVEAPAWALFAATVCWAVAYDTMYAIQDREDDRRIGVKSSAILFGDRAWLAVLICETAMLGCLIAGGWLAGCGVGFYVTLLGVAGFLFVQALRVRTVTKPEDAFRLFAQHVWVGLAVLAGIALGFVW